jgi:hypothetical protein
LTVRSVKEECLQLLRYLETEYYNEIPLLELTSNQEMRMNRKRDETQVITGTCRHNANTKLRVVTTQCNANTTQNLD